MSLRLPCLLLPVSLSLLACANKAPPPDAPGEATAAPSTDTPPPTDAATRREMSAADCEAEGGKVVGDIGDGATQRPDYVCPDGGAPPIGNVVADPGGPIGVEGSVCCA